MPDAPPLGPQEGTTPPVGRAPLLWAALPMLAGYALGGVWPAVEPWKLLAAAAPFIVWAGVIALHAPPTSFRQWRGFPAWGMGFVIGAMFTAWAWHNTAVRRPPDWSGLPPRETSLTLRITQPFRHAPDADYASGLAVVLGTPPVLRELEGHILYYRIRSNERAAPPAPGEVLEVQGLLRFIESAPASGSAAASGAAQARFAAYLNAQGAWFELTRARLVREISPPGTWARWLSAQNARLDALLRRGPVALSEKWGDVYASILLGDPSLLTREQRSAFIVSGTVHLFAISGLQVLILAGAVLWLWRRIPGVPHFLGDAVTLAILWLYTEITGGSPSARRAALMFTFYVLGVWLGRKHSALPAMAAAAVCTLALDPPTLGNAGFQLSYAVVLGLILYAAPFEAAMRARFEPWRDVPPESLAPWQGCLRWLWRGVCATFVVSWTALVCAAPLTMTYFGMFSAYGLALNLLLVPLSVIVLWAGAAAAGLGLLGFPPFTWLAWVANTIGLCGVGWMDYFARWTPPIPGMFLRLRVEPHWAGPAAAAVLLAGMFLGRSRLRQPSAWYYSLPLVVLLVFAALAVRPE